MKAGENALHYAARIGSRPLCDLLLRADCARLVLDAQSTGKGDSPLILAFCSGHGATCGSLLLTAGARDDLCTRNGWDARRWGRWFEDKQRAKCQCQEEAACSVGAAPLEVEVSSLAAEAHKGDVLLGAGTKRSAGAIAQGGC